MSVCESIAVSLGIVIVIVALISIRELTEKEIYGKGLQLKVGDEVTSSIGVTSRVVEVIDIMSVDGEFMGLNIRVEKK